MSQKVTITSVTANTPVDIYYCDSFSASCVYVATVSTFPFEFYVPAPYDETDIVIKIVDTLGCIDGDTVYITPTPTSSQTPTMTQTPTQTASQTPTATNTPTITPTNTATQTCTPTFTPTPSLTPAIATHTIGQNTYSTSANTCNDTITLNKYYTYISEANSVPVLGAKVYQTLVGIVLYNVYNGNNRWIKMGWGVNYYAVQINTVGEIIDFVNCNPVTLTPTPTNTPTQTQTPTPSVTIALTPTATQTQTQTPSITPSQTTTNTQTPTPTTTQTPTNTLTPTTTQTPSGSGSVCTGYTIYSEWSVSSALAGFFKIPSTGVTYLNDTQYTVFSGTATYHTNPSSDVVGGGGVSAQVAEVILNCPTTIDAISTGGEVIQVSVSKTVTCNVYRNGVLVDTKTEVVGPFLIPVTYQFTAMDIGGVISANDVFRFEFL